MRLLLYSSIILGITFLTLRFIGLFLDLTNNDLFLALGLGLLLVVALPLYLMMKRQYQEKVEDILKEYEGDKKRDSTASATQKSTSKENDKKKDVDYPSFRSQKQGLKWGGGNIHGSTATRGSKRGFLKK